MEHKWNNTWKASLVFNLFILSAAILVADSAMAGKVYRWVDENGEVHYSETLPPDFEDKKHDELDDQGIVRAEDQSLVPPPPEPTVEEGFKELPRDSSGMQRPKALYSDEEMQERMDRFLLLRYSSEQEILDAMDVEINQLEYDRTLLQASEESMKEAYRGQIKEAANRQRSGVEVDPEIINSIAGLQNRLAANERSLDGLEARETEIKATFGAELERYRYLIETWDKES
jgi:hypothetical protein